MRSRWLSGTIALATMLSGLVVTAPGDAEVTAASSGPFLDQALAGDPPCDVANFPGTRTLVSTPRTQTFTPSRSDVDAVDLCLTVTVASPVRMVIDGGDLPAPVIAEETVAAGTGFRHFALPTTAPLTPGITYTLRVTGPGDVVLPSNVVAWRLSCGTPQTIALEEDCPAAAPDRYEGGVASGGAFGPNADFGFRTLTPGTADLTGALHVAPRHVCAGAGFPVSASVSNAGSSDVREFDVTAYLSLDDEVDASDVAIGAVSLEDGLIHGATARLGEGTDDDVPFRLDVPTNALGGHDGRVFLLLVVDSNDEVVESDAAGVPAEDNNIVAAQAVLTSCGPASIERATVVAPEAPVPAGVRAVPIELLPIAALPFGPSGIASSPLTNNPLTNNPLTNNPLTNNPLTNNPLTNNPLHDGAGNEGSFLYGAPYEALATVVLANTPLVRAGGWQAVLDAHAAAVATSGGTAPLNTSPLQSLTLLDVMQMAPQPVPPISWSELDLRNSGLGLTLVAAAAGATTLEAIALPDGADWCGGLLAQHGFDCAARAVDPTAATLVTIDLLGFDLTRVPFDRITMADVALHPASPLASVALQAPDPTQEFDPRLTPWAGIVVEGDLVALVDCDDAGCDGTTTLADVTDRDAFADGTTVADLLGALGPEPLGLATLEDVIRGTIHNAAALPLEAASLQSVLLSSLAPSGPFASIEVEVAPSAEGASLVDPTISVALPARFAHVPGSAALAGPDEGAELGEPTVGTDANGRQTLTFHPDLYVPAGSTAVLTLQVNPGEVLGSFDVEATVEGTDLTGTYWAAATPATVQVAERGEPDGPGQDPAAWPELSQDTLTFGHLASPGDVDVWRVPVPAEPQSRIKIVLSHLPADYDVLLGGATSNPLTNNPLTNNGLNSNPLTNNPLTNNAVVPEGGSQYHVDQPAGSTQPETLQDLPLTNNPLTNNGVRAVSVQRGDAVETIVIESVDGEGGYFPLQISGYNGAHSASPYVLRYHVIAPQRVDLGACLPKPFPTGAVSSRVMPSPSSASASTDTLFLIADGRLRDRFGADAAQVRTKLEALAARTDLGVHGLVVPLDGVRADGASNAVATGYAAWDAARCSPAAANDVAGRVRDLVLEYRQALPGIRHVVVIGDDDQVPYLRVRDGSTLANEAGYVSAVLPDVRQGDDAGTPLTTALRAGLFLTDDHLGTAQARPWLDHAAWIPDVGIGRLSGDPATIVAAIDHFTGSNGEVSPEVLTPSHVAVSGYDHLADGSELTATNLEAATGVDSSRLISETWTAQDLRDDLAFPPSSRDVYASINGHADHRRFLPAQQHTDGVQDDLFTADDLASFPFGGVVMSMACHFGYDLTSGDGGAIRDWGDAVMARRGILIANSGYSYGDTVEVAAGELFLATLASNLDGSLSLGEAVAATKGQVYAKEGAYSSEFFKAMQGMVTLGLPMYRVAGTSAAADPPPVAPAQVDPATGQLYVDVTVDLPIVTEASACPAGGNCLVAQTSDRGTHYTAVGPDSYRALAVSGRPIGPRLVFDVTGYGPSTHRVHGVDIVGFESVDVPDVDAAWARATVDSSALEPEVEALGTIFPTRPARVTTVDLPGGEHQYLTLLPWIFRSDRAVDGTVLGTLELFTRVRMRLLLTDSSDNRPAEIGQVEARRQGGNIQLSVVASPVAGAAVAASVLYRDHIGVWRNAPLTSSDGVHWVGTGLLPGTDVDPVELLVDVVDVDGDVGYWRNKGQRIPIAARSEELAIAITGEPGDNGWYTSAVTVELPSLGSGQSYEVSHDGGPFEQVEGTSFVIGTEGVHAYTVRRVTADPSDPGRRVVDAATTIIVAIDTQAPAIDASAPMNGATYRSDEVVNASYTCGDFGPSGFARCDGTVPNGALIDLSAGQHTFTITAEDRAGHVATSTITYTVLAPPIEFVGYFWPLQNDVFNTFEWGDRHDEEGNDGWHHVPFAWRLYRDGAVLTDPALVTSYRWQQVTCASSVTGATDIGASRAVDSHDDWGISSLWRTMFLIAEVPQSFVGTCQRFDLTLVDGEVHSAWLRVVDEKQKK